MEIKTTMSGASLSVKIQKNEHKTLWNVTGYKVSFSPSAAAQTELTVSEYEEDIETTVK